MEVFVGKWGAYGLTSMSILDQLHS